MLREEADAAAGLGLPASFVTDVGLPFAVAGALRFEDQAQFDPFRYLSGLAESVASNGLLFENTRVTGIEHGEPWFANAELWLSFAIARLTRRQIDVLGLPARPV